MEERERKVIEDRDFAVIIWVDYSIVIAQNFDLLKNLGKSTHVHECSASDNRSRFGEIDSTRVYSVYHPLRARADVDVACE